MGSPNEGKCCDAVIRTLEGRAGVARTDQRFPEKEKHGPPIEVECKIAGQTLAVEHTVLESFPDQITTDIFFKNLIPAVEQALHLKLPKPGIYRLVVPTNVQVPAKNVKAVQDALITWVKTKADEFHANNPVKRPRNVSPNGDTEEIRTQPLGVPFEVFFQRELHWGHKTDKHDGYFFVARYAPTDLEGQRVARVATALDKKCPKLAVCKAAGARSILVLEINDIALANHVVVTEAIETLAPTRDDLPDEIWVVSTILDDWSTRLVYEDGVSWPEQGFTEFHKDTLDDLTGSDHSPTGPGSSGLPV